MSTKKSQKKKITNNQVREELFIVIEYLFNFTSAEKPLRQRQLMDYALETYGIEIRRDRIPTICEHLEELTSTYPDKFSFEVISFKLPRQTRYYAVKNKIDEEDVASIIYSINKNPHAAASKIPMLTERLKDLTLTAAQKENLLPHPDYRRYYHNPERLVNLVNTLRSAKDNRALINFTLRKDYDTENYKFRPNVEYFGFVHELMQFSSEAHVIVFVTGDVNQLTSFNIADLSLTGPPIDMEGDAPEISDLYRRAYGGDLSEMLLESTLPFAEGSPQDVTFSFPDTDNNLEIVRNSFAATFRREMEFTKEGNIITVNFRVNSQAFLIWATSLTIANTIKVTGNDVVTRLVYDHYQRQIEKLSNN